MPKAINPDTTSSSSEFRPVKPGSASTVKAFLKEYWLTALILLYLVSPVDFVPEGLLPFIGLGDDALVAGYELVRQWKKFRKETSNV